MDWVSGVTVSTATPGSARDNTGTEKNRPRQYSLYPCASMIGQVGTAGEILV